MPPPLPIPGASGALIPPSGAGGAAPAAPAAAGPAPITLKDGTQLDPSVVKVMKSIATVESGTSTGINYNAVGDKGASMGAFQWNNGKTAVPKGQLPANFVAAAKANGLDPTDFSPANQNKVAYAQIAAYKAKGLTPNSIDALWNGASPDPSNPGQYVHNDPTRLAKFQDALSGALKSPAPVVAPTASQTADQASSQASGAFFPAVTGDSPLAAGLKTLGNLPSSAFSFAKGVLNSINPVQIASTIGQIPGAFSSAVSANGGDVGKTILSAAEAAPGEAYKALVPQGVRSLIAGDVPGALREVENNPVGTIAPLALGAEGLARGVDATTGAFAKSQMADYVDNIGENTANGVPIPGGGTDVAGALDKGVSRVAGAVTSPFSYAFGKAADIAGGLAKSVVSKVSGLSPDTLAQITANPSAFTPEQIGSASRTSLGAEVGDALQGRIDALGDTGAKYSPIRNGDATVTIDPEFLGTALEKATGLTLDDKGNFAADAKSAVDSPTDIAKVQRIYDAWQPYFDKGEMTADDFLTLRTKLSKMANFDTSFGKSQPLEGAAASVRGALNDTYRDGIPGLAEADADYTSQSGELATLRKGLIDKDGNLTDSAINRIANATGKGKDALLGRLEEVSPGITLKIRQLKAVEDIQNVAGSGKVGTYSKTLVEGGGFGGLGAGIATMNVPLIVGSIAALILTQPEVAVRMIRGYGQYAAPIATKVLASLKSGASAVNNLPSAAPAQVIGAFSPRATVAAQ